MQGGGYALRGYCGIEVTYWKVYFEEGAKSRRSGLIKVLYVFTGLRRVHIPGARRGVFV